MDKDPLVRSHDAEAVQAAAVAEEARQKAAHASLVQALREVLTDNGNDDSRPLLIKRIPLICNDIRSIKNDMQWIKWLGSGFIVAAGALALKSLGL